MYSRIDEETEKCTATSKAQYFCSLSFGRIFFLSGSLQNAIAQFFQKEISNQINLGDVHNQYKYFQHS